MLQAESVNVRLCAVVNGEQCGAILRELEFVEIAAQTARRFYLLDESIRMVEL